MTPEAQRIAIAEACGCKRYKRPFDGKVFLCRENPASGTWEETSQSPCKLNSDIPDYLNDLNAMHEAEETIIIPQKLGLKYENRIEAMSGESFGIYHATAAQRAEAFLRTLGKWPAQPPQSPIKPEEV
jgi:hypothetical protein